MFSLPRLLITYPMEISEAIPSRSFFSETGLSSSYHYFEILSESAYTNAGKSSPLDFLNLPKTTLLEISRIANRQDYTRS